MGTMGHSLLKLSEISWDTSEQSAYVRGYRDGKAGRDDCAADYSRGSREKLAYLAGYETGYDARIAAQFHEAVAYSTPPFTVIRGGAQ